MKRCVRCRLRLSKSDPLPEPSDEINPQDAVIRLQRGTVSAHVPIQILSQLRTLGQRKPNLPRSGWIQTRKLLCRYSDNRYRNVVQPNCLSYCRWISTEGPLPKAVRQDRHRGRTRRVVGKSGCPTEGRADAEGVKKFAGDQFAMRKSGQPIASEVKSSVAAERNHAGKRVLKRLKPTEHWIGKRTTMFGGGVQ